MELANTGGWMTDGSSVCRLVSVSRAKMNREAQEPIITFNLLYGRKYYPGLPGRNMKAQKQQHEPTATAQTMRSQPCTLHIMTSWAFGRVGSHSIRARKKHHRDNDIMMVTYERTAVPVLFLMP
jgi:hypothetical protein